MTLEELRTRRRLASSAAGFSLTAVKQMASFTLRAFAKINLSLRVRRGAAGRLPRGSDDPAGDRSLRSRERVDARRGPFEIRCDMPGVPIDRTNLVWKAAQQLWDAAGRERRTARRGRDARRRTFRCRRVSVVAAAMRPPRFWAFAACGSCACPTRRSHAIAARLGSDVPFFLVGGTALGLGRGEEVYPLDDLPRLWVVLVMPSFGVATKDAYRVVGTRKGVGCIFRERVEKCTRPLFASDRPARQRPRSAGDRASPGDWRVEATARTRGALMAAMSGSGSTVFGVVRVGAAATAAARALSKTARASYGAIASSFPAAALRSARNLPVSPSIV